MKPLALVCSALLACSSVGLAASPDELWKNYQERPSAVSTVPQKPAAATKPAPHITVETPAGDVVAADKQTAVGEAPQAQAEQTVKTDVVATRVTTTPTPGKPATATKAAEPAAEKAATNVAPAAKAEPAAKGQKATATEAAKKAAGKAPVVSNKPVPAADKPKPKPSLVGKPPASKQYLRTPQAGDFATVTNAAGGYSIAVPKGFGSDPLAQLPGAAGAMLVRTVNDSLMLASTVLDAGDSTSYKATEPLPAYADARLYCAWQHPGAPGWECRLSRHNDYHGDKLLLQAQAQQAGKTYQLLFVLPKGRQDVYLPQALYSLHSFKLL